MRGVPGSYEELARNGKFKDVEVDGRLETLNQTSFSPICKRTGAQDTHLAQACVSAASVCTTFARMSALFSWFTVSPQTLLLLHVVCVLCVHRYANERVLCPCGGFRWTARFSVLQLRVQECDTQASSTFSYFAPVAQSLLHINEKIVWCQDIPRACVQVI